MKICFILQRRFAYVGHKMALIFKEKYGINEFCGYVYTRASFEFLKKQTDINYTSLLLDEEIHKSYKNEPLDLDYIAWLEREYGLPNLWPYIAVDRVVMYNMLAREYPYDTPPYTHEEMMRILQVKAKAIINFLETARPDVIFFTVVGGIGAMLLYHIAKKKNIKVFIIALTRINRLHSLSISYKKLSYAENLFNDLMLDNKESKKIKEAEQYLNEFRHKDTSPLYASLQNQNRLYRLRPLKWLSPKNLWGSCRWFTILCYRYFAGRQDGYCDEKPLGYLIDRIRRKTRTLIGFKHLYDKIDFNEDFAFFALHYEPEIATLLFAPFWSDQINLIKQVAKSLPLHFKLYVKEHPAMVGYRPHAYYRELKKIPNVKLLDPDVSSFQTIRQSKLIATITSTAGWEAVLLKKPVITFGDTFYNKLSTVIKCEKIDELPIIVKKQLANFKYNEQELVNFIGAIMEESADVGLNEIWEVGVEPAAEKVRLTRLVDLMAKKLNIPLLT